MGDLMDFVTTSRRATSKATPIYPITKDNHEKVFNSIDSMNMFDKLKEVQKAKDTPQVIHYLKCAAIKSDTNNENILQVNIRDDCSRLPKKTRNEIVAALETQLNPETWDKLKPFLKTALPWTET